LRHVVPKERIENFYLLGKAKIVNLKILAVRPDHAQRIFDCQESNLIPHRFVFSKYVHVTQADSFAAGDMLAHTTKGIPAEI
jgi:hypothetical protein